MTLEDVKDIFRQFDKFKKSIAQISYDEANKETLCSLSNEIYCYDDIIGSRFVGHDTIKSFDGIAFKDDWIHFIEFKNGKIGSKQKQEIRLMVAEGLHYLERVLLNSEFFFANHIKTKFILVYSEEKNQQESVGQKILNEGLLAFSTLKYNKFIDDKYDVKWKYVDKAISLSEKRFVEEKDQYI